METIKTFNKISYDQISYAKIRLMVRVYYKIENDLPKNMTKYKLDNILREKIRNTPYHNDNRYYVYHYLIDYYNNNNNNDELENDITKEELRPECQTAPVQPRWHEWR